MDFFENRYYNLNRKLLLLIGQWPYQSKWQRFAVALLIFVILAIMVLVQFLKFVEVWRSVQTALEILQTLVPTLMFVVNYCNYVFNSKKMGILLNDIKQDWSLLTAGSETEILQKYGEGGRLYTLSFIIIFYSVGCGFIVVTNAPYIQNIVFGLNVTQSYEMPINAEFFTLNEKCFYGLLIFLYFDIFLGCHIVAAAVTLFNIYVQHACGLYTIIGYQLTHVFDSVTYEIDTESGHNQLYKKIVDIIQLHQRTIRFVSIVNSCYASTYLIQLAFLIVLLSIDIYQIFQALKSPDEFGKLVIYLLYVCAALSAVAIVCVAGQDMINHSDEVFQNAYATQWFRFPIKSQKLMLQLMTRTIRPTPIAVLQSYPASMELFDTALQATMSYFMALYSL